MLERTSGDLLQSPCREKGQLEHVYGGLCPIRFWASPRMETQQVARAEAALVFDPYNMSPKHYSNRQESVQGSGGGRYWWHHVKAFSSVWVDFAVFHFVSVDLWLGTTDKSLALSSLVPSIRFLDRWIKSPEPSLHQAKQSQLSQLLPKCVCFKSVLAGLR